MPARRFMCELALVGAEGDAVQLLGMLGGSHNELDASLASDAESSTFPSTDTVVRVTLGGCSCALLKGLGSAGRSSDDAHVAGPGYAFRRGIAAVALACGGARLRIVRGGQACESPPRVASLGDFLRFGLTPRDAFIAIVP